MGFGHGHGLLVPKERLVAWSSLALNWIRLLTGREWQRRWLGRQLLSTLPVTETMAAATSVPSQERIARSVFTT